MTKSKTVNGKQKKAEMRTPSKAQETVDGAESKRTRKTKASRNGTERMEESKYGQNTRPQKRKQTRPKGDSRKPGRTRRSV